MKELRVMHLIHELGAGGAENGIINIANNIDRDRFAISICALKQSGSRTSHVHGDVDLFTMDKSEGNSFKLPFQLNSLFKTWQPDIVHTHAWGTLFEGYLGARIARVPVIIHGEHGTIQDKWFNRYFQNILWRRFDAVLSVSHQHKQKLGNVIGFPEDKITVLINGVDSDLFCPKIRKNLFNAEEKTVIGTIGRLVPVKNQALLIKSFSKVHDRFPNTILIIVGGGPLSEELKALAASLSIEDKIIFTGVRFDIPDVLNCMDIFVLPSISEGMSNTILEAMSCQLPVIATDVGGNSELVLDNATGLLTESEDVDQMTECIIRLLENKDLRSEFGIKSRALVLDRFSLSKMVHRYENLYKKVFRKHQ